MKKFTADFETATWLNDETYVWAWATCEIGNEENLQIGKDINDFIEYCLAQNNSTFYFHNAKFDLEFVIYWAFKHGFRHVESIKEAEDMTFTTLISDMGQFYTMTLYFKKQGKHVKKITFIDSLKIIPFGVDTIAKSFNLPISKLKIDYNEVREKGHRLTLEEKEYIKNDVLIVAKALKFLFDEGLTKMTQGSNALHHYKEILKKTRFEHFFPKLEPIIDADLRKAYRGGFTYLNPIYKEKEVGAGSVLDVNSLYPSVMRTALLPFGEPVYFDGKYKEDKVYPLYIQMLTCCFKVKKDKIPTIQLKKNLSFLPNEYIENSGINPVCLTLTNIDLQLFLEHYDVYNLNYECGWKFKGITGLFDKYIDYWIEVKNKATIEGNKGMRTLAKLMLNSLYGKFSTKLTAKSKVPYLRRRRHYTL